MIRKIIEVKDEYCKIHIPKEYMNKKIEILILPFEESNASKILQKTSGILKGKRIDPIKWQEEIKSERF